MKLINFLVLLPFMITNLVDLLLTISKNGECEITSLDSLREGIGIGTALIEAAKSVVRNQGCERLWLITTNDNIKASVITRNVASNSPISI